MSSKMIIAISGKSGCGNSSVSTLVSESLDLRLVNYTFREMAKEKGLTFQELRERAEKDDSIDIELDIRQVEMAKKGNCVLGSRLAIWVMKDADLTVYLKASPEVRAARITRREGGDPEVKLRETIERDRLDRDRYLRIYNIDNDKYDFADLVIDTDVLDQYEVAEKIISAARSFHV